MINSISKEKLLPLPVGVSSFKNVVEEYYYVDKTLFIKELRTNRSKVTLITRPRRFGKTLNLNMLKCFFEKTEESNQYLFENLNIWKCGEKFTSEQGKYPVIYLTLKDIKADNWNTLYRDFQELISDEFLRHKYILKNDSLNKYEKDYYDKILSQTANQSEFETSLKRLSEFLYKYHRIAPIILIDEYDTPVQYACSKGFYEDAKYFISNWMSGGLKDNRNLSFAVMTGILNIAHERVVSGLNNVSSKTLFNEAYNSYFGFTEEEVVKMAEYYGATDKISEIKAWYDGYNFAGLDIYNPWSIINYFDDKCKPGPYWVSTSGNGIIKQMLEQTDFETKKQLYNLVNGKTECVSIDLSIVYPNLNTEPHKIFSLLLMAGYLKVKNIILNQGIYIYCDVVIPNYEIKEAFRAEIIKYSRTFFLGTTKVLCNIFRAIVENDTEKLNTELNQFLLQSMSFMDAKSEDFYQGFMLCLGGLFTDKYELKQNLEAGYGRYDFALTPLKEEYNLPGIVMEFKALTGSFKNEDEMKAELQKTAQKALEQIEVKKYDTAMFARGLNTVLHYGLAFHKKNVVIESRLVSK